MTSKLLILITTFAFSTALAQRPPFGQSGSLSQDCKHQSEPGCEFHYFPEYDYDRYQAATRVEINILKDDAVEYMNKILSKLPSTLVEVSDQSDMNSEYTHDYPVPPQFPTTLYGAAQVFDSDGHKTNLLDIFPGLKNTLMSPHGNCAMNAARTLLPDVADLEQWYGLHNDGVAVLDFFRYYGYKRIDPVVDGLRTGDVMFWQSNGYAAVYYASHVAIYVGRDATHLQIHYVLSKNGYIGLALESIQDFGYVARLYANNRSGITFYRK